MPHEITTRRNCAIIILALILTALNNCYLVNGIWNLGEMAEFKKIFETEKFLLKIGGLYPSVEKHLFYSIARIVSVTITVTQVISMFIMIPSQISDLTKVSENLHYTATQIGFTCKMINFMWHGKELLELEDTIKRLIFTDVNEEEEKLMMKVVNVTRLQTKIFRFLCIVAFIFIGSKPFFDRNADGSRKLPITISLPFDVNKYYYQVSYVSIFTVGLGEYLNCNLDVIAITLITFGCGRLEILKNKFEKLVASGQREPDLILKQKLKEYAKQLNDIYCYISTVQKIFSVGMFVQLPCSVLIMCFTIFQLFMVAEETTQIVYYILYGSCIVCQIFLYSMCGQRTAEISAELTDACFRSRWYDCSNCVQKYFLIIRERCKRPVVIRAGNFFTLNLQTFMGILKTSYSYFALLRQLYNKN